MATHTYPTPPEGFTWRPQRHIPVTPMQALMESAPFADPEESMLEKQERLEPFRRLLEDADVLTERERHVLYGIFWRGRSLAQIGRELGVVKSTVFHLRESAFEKLRQVYDVELGAAADPTKTVDP